MGVSALVKKVLAEVGINPDRFGLQWASAAEAPRFVKLITDFTMKTKELGPIGESEGLSPEELKVRIDKALALVSDRKLRIALGNATKTIRKETIFTQEGITALIEEKLSKTITSGLEGSGAEVAAKK
ncbi:MAG: hydrogenase iron-sulfur subunit [Proteobacteria bacterium]|nr:hydrogenase iron-sulfur subunit [Pseudomonadota bacterium]